MYTYMYICIHICIYAYTCIYVYIYICTCIHIYVRIYAYMCVCMYICVYVHMYTYTHICIYMCAYTCIYVCACICICILIYFSRCNAGILYKLCIFTCTSKYAYLWFLLKKPVSKSNKYAYFLYSKSKYLCIFYAYLP